MRVQSSSTVTSVADVRQAALRLLVRREHSCVELRRKLLQRSYAPELVEQVLQQLLAQDLLSELRFTESYVRARANKGYGPLRIIEELRQRGVDEELIVTQIDSLTEQWLHNISKVRQKRFGTHIPKDFTERAREMRFLQYRGFTTEQIKQVFNELIKQ